MSRFSFIFADEPMETESEMQTGALQVETQELPGKKSPQICNRNPKPVKTDFSPLALGSTWVVWVLLMIEIPLIPIRTQVFLSIE